MTTQEMVALLVEDEPLTAMLAAGILRDIGYVVFEARTKEEADKLLLGEIEYNLLLTDVELADGSSGAELAFEVARSQPDIHILVTSGRPRPAILPDKADFLSKPYSERSLREMAMRSR